MSRHLFEPITDNGIRNTNFFNGRLLSADDLAAVLDSGSEHDRQLAAGLGEGVVRGLEVELASSSTPTQPVVRVGGGLALNRAGNPVALSVPAVDVALVRAPETFAPEAGLFAECQGPEPPDNLSRLGVYVFVASPASAYEGSVPTRHSVTSDKFDGCGRRYAVEGVKFRMERIDFSSLAGVSQATRTVLGTLTTQTDDASISKLRNVVAHLCFDSEEPGATLAGRRDPFNQPAGDAAHVNYGALNALRDGDKITDCEVPLAVIYWSPQGVQFVDTWAVRRLARRVLDLDVLSLLRSHGYERLLQFERHLRDLFDRLSNLGTLQLQNYFQFLPPVGFFPVLATKSPRGFHATNFFRQFATGAAGQITAERFGALLRESFACPDVDLAARPVFQIYQVRDNARLVAASASTSQLYQVFVSRAMNGPLARDGVAAALYDAWEVYRGLVKRRAFLPSGNDQDTIATHSLITNGLRDVLDMSNRQYALAAGGALDTPDAIKAFQEMHRVQNDLVTLFLTGLTIPDPTLNRANFAQALALLLNNTSSAGVPGLLPAVQANNLLAAVDAQNAINHLVGNWSGVGVAIGPVIVTRGIAPEGEQLKLGSTTPLPLHYNILNGTDQRLTINLDTTITAPHGDWTGSAKIFSQSDQEISSIELNPGVTGTVIVKVTTASGAGRDDNVTLTLRADVPPPADKHHSAQRSLVVKDDLGGAVLSSVVFVVPVAAPTGKDMTNADPNKAFTYVYVLRYNPAPGVTAPANFLFTVRLSSTGSPVEEWNVTFHDTASPGGDRQLGTYTQQIQLFPTESHPVLISVVTPARAASTGADKTATFTARVESINLTPPVTPITSEAKSITVRKS